MANNVGPMSKSLTASSTLERFLSCMCIRMKLEPFIPGELFTTEFATKPLYVEVSAGMPAEVGAVGEAPPTALTSVWFRLAVRRHVRLQLSFASEGLATMASVILL